MAGDTVAFAPTWHDMLGLCGRLAQAVRADGVPDVVVGVARGGLVPAVMISHLLGVRDLRSLTVAHTTTDAVAAPKTERPTVGDPAALGSLTGLDVLVVDDVAGTGQALAVTAALVRCREPARVRRAVVVVNHENWFAANDDPPGAVIDYVGTWCPGWVAFPWEETR